jgi:acetylglutamate/LysW-gamma-L-alpha-aminoadipate kinase
VGVTGRAGRRVPGARNPGLRARAHGNTLRQRAPTGQPRQINAALLTLLLDNGYCPVLTIPIVDENGFAINSENDDIIVQLAQALDIDSVVQLIEAPGFLDDPTDESSLVAKMSLAELEAREATVEGRIKRKLLALTRLCQGGKTRVIIADGRGEKPVINALAGAGTHIS